jgi:hypothetical protein
MIFRRLGPILTSLCVTSIIVEVVAVKRWKRDVTVIVAGGRVDCYHLANVTQSSELEISFEVSKSGVDVRIIIFLRFVPIFGEKIGVFLKNQCYDQNFA